MLEKSSIGRATLVAFVTTPLLFSAGRAAVVTVDFSGTVAQVTAPLTSTNFGTTFVGSFSYNSPAIAVAASSGPDFSGGSYALYNLSSFSLKYSGGYSFPALNNATIDLSAGNIVGPASSWSLNVLSSTGQMAQVSFGFEGPLGYLSSTSLDAGLPFFNGSSNPSPVIFLGFFYPNFFSAGTVIGKITSIAYEPTSPAAGSPIATPEPASLALLGMGVASIAAMRRRRAS